MTDTLIGDAEGVYHPGLFHDRLVVGLKGTLSEAELPILRARLDGGIRNQAARGELRRGLPVGFGWGEENSEVRFPPDAAVTSTLRTVFERFAELDVSLSRSRPATLRTEEDTGALVRRLAVHYPDAVIAGILNKQDRATARALRFPTHHVGNLRHHGNIPPFEPITEPLAGELLSIKQAATIEQLTPDAPWRIRLDDELRRRFVEEGPAGHGTMQEATKMLGVSRQTVLQRVKRGELDAVQVYCGRRKGLRIRVIDSQPDLFTHSS